MCAHLQAGGDDIIGGSRGDGGEPGRLEGGEGRVLEQRDAGSGIAQGEEVKAGHRIVVGDEHVPVHLLQLVEAGLVWQCCPCDLQVARDLCQPPCDTSKMSQVNSGALSGIRLLRASRERVQSVRGGFR